MTSTDLDVFSTTELDPALARQLTAQWREAQRLAVTSVVPRSITHKRVNKNGNWIDERQPDAVIAATVFAVVRYGDFFGFDPAIALGKIDVIEGRLEARYDALAGLMMDAGHQVRVREATAERAIVAVRRREDRDDPDGWQVTEFTLDEAKQAGYIKAQPTDRDMKSAWMTRRADMLVSKAIKRACRWFTPDVLVQGADPSMIEGASVEQLASPPAAPETAPPPSPVDPDDEPIDAELVEDEPTESDEEAHGRLQRQLMATATKAFPKDEALLPAAQRAKRDAQRHAVTYVAIQAHKSSNDMTLEELRKVIARLDDVVQGRLQIEERDGQWIAVQGDRELPIPPETEAEAAA